MKLTDLTYSHYKKNRICGIYMIINNINNKCYIGQSVNIYYRIYEHINASKNNSKNNKSYDYPLCRSFRKYGIKNFELKILELCDKSELNCKEIYYIKKFDSTDSKYGYNQTSIVENSMYREVKLTLEEVDEITKLLLGNKLSVEEIAKKFNVFRNNIYNINSGFSFYRSNLDYPLKKLYVKEINCMICNKKCFGYRNGLCDYCKSIYKKYSNYKRNINYKGQDKSLDKPKKGDSVHCNHCNKLFEYKFNSKFCSSKCFHLSRTSNSKPTIEELTELIKLNSLTKIGKIYGVSSNTISKWCKIYGLPYKSSDIKKYFKDELYDTKFERDKIECKVCGSYFMPSKNKFSYCSEKCRLENLKGHKLRNNDITFEEIIKVMNEKDTFIEVYKNFRTNYKVMRSYCERYKIPFNMEEFNLWYKNYNND